MNPRDILSLSELFVSAGIVAACVLPVYVLLLAISLGSPGKLIHRWHKPPGSPRPAYIMLGFFPILLVISQINTALFVNLLSRGLWQHLGLNPDPSFLNFAAILIVAPLMAMIVICIRFAFTNVWVPVDPTFATTCRAIVRGIHTWAVFLPLTFLVYYIVLQFMIAMDYAIELHPLAKLRPENDGYNGWLFGIAACVCTPWLEEMLFRGMIVPWVVRRAMAPWLVMAIAWGLMVLVVEPGKQANPVAFMACLTIGLYAILRFGPKIYPRFPTRNFGAIYSSAALFAIVHASVWPTPIPLFVLGLGLGYIVARTGQILPAVVVHGLFNAVSFVMVLRSTPPV